MAHIYQIGVNKNYFLAFSESQTEINVAEQDLRKAKDTKQDIERKLRVVEEERSSLEKVATEV